MNRHQLLFATVVSLFCFATCGSTDDPRDPSGEAVSLTFSVEGGDTVFTCGTSIEGLGTIRNRFVAGPHS